MSYLLDTNVISELVRPKPARNVLAWFEGRPNDSLYLSVLSLGEIRKGIERLPNGARREQLRLWLEQELPTWFGERCLAVTVAVAECWGRLMTQAPSKPGAVDSLIAATALHYGLRVVTRNESDFRFPGLDVVNPWRSE